jgi:hypothetical protein
LVKALVERVEADQARLIGLIEERNHLRDDLQETRAEADHAKSDQVRMAQDVAGMLALLWHFYSRLCSISQ